MDGYEQRCVRCDVPMAPTSMSCPAGLEGCDVAHSGLRCPTCGGAVFVPTPTPDPARGTPEGRR